MYAVFSVIYCVYLHAVLHVHVCAAMVVTQQYLMWERGSPSTTPAPTAALCASDPSLVEMRDSL